MAQQAFVVGDVVQLKSGGPNMTVTTVEGKEIFCEWFSGDSNEVKRYVFPPDALRKAGGAAGPVST